MRKKLQFVKNPWLVLTGGVVLGALLILTIRFFSYAPEHVHFHANFAVYLNGQREEFKGPQYYQEVAICSATTGITVPQQRAHMHDNINSVVHVHDHAVTWGQFFENFDWSVGSDFIETDDGTMYRQDETNKLHIIINGQDYSGLVPIANTLIKDKDRLLISFGNESDQDVMKQFKTVPATAAHYDVAKDPASCSGHEHVSASERFKHLLR